MNHRQNLIVVGSGISGIMTAWQAMLAGYSVELFSKSPDPRSAVKGADQQSSTFDSKNDQRYITIFEGHPYLELEGYVNKVYPGIANDFQTGVLDGGILVDSPKSFSQRSQRWLGERSRLNAKLLDRSQREVGCIASLFGAYARENRMAMERWYQIMTALAFRSPQTLHNLSLNTGGIVRLYDNAEVFGQSLASHKTEQVFKKQYTPAELVKEYPAYSEGVQRGFIAGGAIEIYGLTFSVGHFCRAILGELERGGVRLCFGTEVKQVVVNRQKQVQGLLMFGEAQTRIADHYVFHTGAFAGPELFEFVGQAQNKLAAVEGYWITIEQADKLVAAMGDRPNKVHGKMSLEAILGMVDPASASSYRQRFRSLGVDESSLGHIAPIVDFNNMPIRQNGQVSLGVGSGYIFKGVGERGDSGKVVFQDQPRSDQFVLAVMELWLEALHGKELLSTGKMVVHPKGCKRSFTPGDKELDVNVPTASGGVCMIHDGGNTGSTTKSPFIAAYVIEKMRKAADSAMDAAAMKRVFARLRRSLGKTAEQVPETRWQQLSAELNRQINH